MSTVNLEFIDYGELARRLVQNCGVVVMAGGRTYTEGSGAPSASAKKGSMYMDVSTGNLYANTSGSTTWTKVGLET